MRIYTHTTPSDHITSCLTKWSKRSAEPRPMIPLLWYKQVSCGVSYPWKNWEAWRKMLMGQHKLKCYTISWKASWPPQASKSKRKKHSRSTTKYSVSKHVTVILYYGKPDMNNSIILFIYIYIYIYIHTHLPCIKL
jgi:hypothetical protein